MNSETFVAALSAALVLIYTAVIAPTLLSQGKRIGELEKENRELGDELQSALIEVAKLQSILHVMDLGENFRITETMKIEFREPKPKLEDGGEKPTH